MAWACVGLVSSSIVPFEDLREVLASCLNDAPTGANEVAEAVSTLGGQARVFMRQLVGACLAEPRELTSVYPQSYFGSLPAANLLRTLKPTRVDLLPAVETLAKAGALAGGDEARWCNAWDLLTRLGPESGVVAEDLTKLLRSEHARVRAAAAECLGAIGKPDAAVAIPALKTLYYEDERRVRYQAGQALAGLLGRTWLRGPDAKR
jgi:hypothetical protein